MSNRVKLNKMLKRVMMDQIIKIRVVDDFKDLIILGEKWQSAKDKHAFY
jgi:hypothetical protein